MKALVRRIQRLESHERAMSGIRIRLAELRRLPEAYKGERHLKFVGHLPNRGSQEWVEYEEVPGPNPIPPQPRGGIPKCINIIFVRPYRNSAAASEIDSAGKSLG